MKAVGRGCVGIGGVEKTSKEVGHFVEVSFRRRQAGRRCEVGARRVNEPKPSLSTSDVPC